MRTDTALPEHKEGRRDVTGSSRNTDKAQRLVHFNVGV